MPSIVDTSYVNILSKKGTYGIIVHVTLCIQVTHHQKLGNSKEEFLQENAAQMATASHVIILLTEPAINSPFVFHEVLFADWLGKKLLTAVFRNMWFALRPSLKAVLGKPNRTEQISQLYIGLLRQM